MGSRPRIGNRTSLVNTQPISVNHVVFAGSRGLSLFCSNSRKSNSVVQLRILLTSTGLMTQITDSNSEPMPSRTGALGSGDFARSGSSHLAMATTLAPVDSREVVRCDHCLL